MVLHDGKPVVVSSHQNFLPAALQRGVEQELLAIRIDNESLTSSSTFSYRVRCVVRLPCLAEKVSKDG